MNNGSRPIMQMIQLTLLGDAHQNALRDSLKTALAAIALISITILVYFPAIHGGFIMDDDLLLTNNPLIKAPDGFWRFWATKSTPDYYPILSDSFWLEWRLWGLNATGYHTANILLHAINAALLWRVLTRLNIPGAWLASLIFAIHPVNVRSVAWIAEQKNVLAMFFYLLAVLFYFHSTRTGKKHEYWASVFTFALSLLTKTSGIMLPIILIILIWRANGRVARQDVLSTVPFFFLSCFLGVLTVVFQGHQITPVPHLAFSTHLALAGNIFWFYFFKAVLPLQLSFIYPLWNLHALSLHSFAPTVALVICFYLFWRYRAGWGKPLLVGLGYYFVSLIPFLGFFRMAFFQHSYVADHLQYFAIIGIISVLTSFVAKKSTDSRPTISAFCILMLVGVLSVLAWRQASLYRNVETIALDTLNQNPSSFWAHDEHGICLGQRGEFDKASLEFREAIRLNPRYAMAHNNLGYTLRKQGNLDEASRELSKAIQLYPHFAVAHENLGYVLAQKKDYTGAANQFQAASHLTPHDAADMNNFRAATRMAKSRQAN